jgi:hypothetical protein
MIRTEPLRLPSERELDLMARLLSEQPSLVRELREQSTNMLVARNCDCGCESFDIVPDSEVGSAPAALRVISGSFDPVSAVEVLPVLRDGRLNSVEITYFGGEVAGIPPLERIGIAHFQLDE